MIGLTLLLPLHDCVSTVAPSRWSGLDLHFHGRRKSNPTPSINARQVICNNSYLLHGYLTSITESCFQGARKGLAYSARDMGAALGLSYFRKWVGSLAGQLLLIHELETLDHKVLMRLRSTGGGPLKPRVTRSFAWSVSLRLDWDGLCSIPRPSTIPKLRVFIPPPFH